MRYLLVGGTFNPVHYGHLFLAEEVRNVLRYDVVLFIPTNIPVHKMSSDIVEARHRLQMLRIALDPYSNFRVEDCEIQRRGRSYTIDTIVELEKKYNWVERPGFIIGDDLATTFHTWKESEKLVDLVDLIVVHRLYRERVRLGYRHTYVDNFMLPISSSEIRKRIREKRTVKFLLPDDVLNYIIENELYI